MAISQPPFQSTLVDADDRVQTPWAQWFSQLQPILQSVVASGPTAGRPTQNLFIGYPYFDTTLDQMVYWNGVIWVTYAPSTTGTSILKGNGTGGFNNAIAGIDFAPATSGTAILYGNGAGGFSSVAIGSGVTFAGGVLSALGSGGTVTSVSGTGSVNGITLTGTVTSAGSLTLGGTLGGIGNSQLTNSSITINGSTVSLGGSTTVTATATNALTIGTGLSGTSYDGSTAVTIANAGVLSITGTALQITASASTGAVTLSLPSSINVNTTGYAAGLAGGGANYVPYQTAVNTTGFVSPGVVGQVFTSTGSGSAPNWQNATSPPGSPGYYGAWHDTSTVTATSTTTAYVMAIGAIDLENGTSIVGGTKITIANTGVYNLQFSAQLSNPNSQIADVSIWIRLNGVDVTDGAGTNGVPAKHGSNNGLQIISWNYVLNLTAGDYIELVWRTDTTGVQLITFPATTSPAVPESPSLIVTIQAVTQIGIGYQGLTSASSVLIATGSKVFTTNFTNSQTAFAIGTRVRVAYTSIPANFMEGVVTAFSGTTFTVLVDSIGGSGTFASWTISVAGIQGSNGVTSITGTANQVIASASTGAITLSLPQSINSGAAPTFLGTNFTGTASLNINGTVGATTATTGKFTTLEYTSTLTGGTGIIAIGTTQIYKDASGNVGIGTSSPTSKISIKGTTTTDAPTLGTEFITGGTWTSTGWTGDNTTGWVNGAGNSTALSYSVAAVISTRYQIAYTVTGYSAGSFTIAFGGQSLAGIIATGTFGPTTTTTGNLVITPTSTFVGTIIISIKAITAVSTALITALDSSGSTRFEIRALAATLNTYVGLNSGRYNTTGTSNCAFGANSMLANTTGLNNTVVGAGSLGANTTGKYNSGVGSNILASNSTGNNNSAFGFSVMVLNSSGSSNSALGYAALYNNTTGNSNVAFGVNALQFNTTGGSNTSFGQGSTRNNTTGSNNTVVGGGAGTFLANGTTSLTIVNNSTYIGYGTKASVDSVTNETVIGYNAIGIGSNTSTIGSSATTATKIFGVTATGQVAPTIASATTIAPVTPVVFISGTTAIATITAPTGITLTGGQITLIPTGIFTTTTAGNIALASTAVVSKALIMTYDATTTKWYPSY